jgi:hypothetical protein
MIENYELRTPVDEYKHCDSLRISRENNFIMSFGCENYLTYS